MSKKKTQGERILDYMKEFGSITPQYAMRDLGVMRLASRISDLKKDGSPIESRMEPVKNRWGEKTNVARYSLRSDG